MSYCPECDGKGYIEDPGCNCGVGPSGYYGMHERYCGLESCPRGCPFTADRWILDVPSRPARLPITTVQGGGKWDIKYPSPRKHA